MIIDFDKIEVSVMPAFKGGEKETPGKSGRLSGGLPVY